MKCLVLTKILFYTPWTLAALLRSDGENRRVQMSAVAGYHAVVCDAFFLQFIGPETVFQSMLSPLPERGRKKKDIQTAITHTYCKHSRPFALLLTELVGCPSCEIYPASLPDRTYPTSLFSLWWSGSDVGHNISYACMTNYGQLSANPLWSELKVTQHSSWTRLIPHPIIYKCLKN